MRLLPLALVLSPVLAACAHRPDFLTPDRLAHRLARADRTAEDKALDPGRKPLEFLSFVGLGDGMRVAELMAGGGYTAELLSVAVGPAGIVYGVNPKLILERFAEQPWSERLKRVRLERLDRELDSPFPEMLEGTLDAVVSNAIYHDTVWLEVDRGRMNQAVLTALKPAGAYVVCDSSAKPGTGVSHAQSLHRIDEQVVRQEILAAGFTLEAEGDFLRNPSDTRDWNASPRAAAERRGTSDRFCLRFTKPVPLH
jgi:predicted methyltransferase